MYTSNSPAFTLFQKTDDANAILAFFDFASSMKAFRSPFRDASRISTETSSPDLSQPKITSLSSNSSSANTPFLTLTTRTSASGSYRIKLHCCLLFKIRNLTGHFQIKLGLPHTPRVLSLNPPTRSTQQNQQSSIQRQER